MLVLCILLVIYLYVKLVEPKIILQHVKLLFVHRSNSKINRYIAIPLSQIEKPLIENPNLYFTS